MKSALKLWYYIGLFPVTTMGVEAPNEFKLNNPPTDGVSAVKFSPVSPQFLLVSSWDSSVRLYDTNNNSMRIKYTHSAPVLDCCFYVSVVCLCLTMQASIASHN